jgi:hypothetical protein
MASKDRLTTERLKKKFNSPFDLVNYSIKLAKDMIYTGRGCRVDTTVGNKAYQVLLEIAEDKDYLTEIVNDEYEDDEELVEDDKE